MVGENSPQAIRLFAAMINGPESDSRSLVSAIEFFQRPGEGTWSRSLMAKLIPYRNFFQRLDRHVTTRTVSGGKNPVPNSNRSG
jgi:hypothetical protein